MALTSLKSSIMEVTIIKFGACKSEKLIRKEILKSYVLFRNRTKKRLRVARAKRNKICLKNILLRVRPTRTRARCARGTQDFLRDHPSVKF